MTFYNSYSTVYDFLANNQWTCYLLKRNEIENIRDTLDIKK